MKTLYLPYISEATAFSERLNRLDQSYQFKVERDPDWGYKLPIDKKNLTEDTIQHLSKTFISIFTSFRLVGMIDSLLREAYYFSDEEEIGRILELSQDIILKQDEEGFVTYKNKKVQRLLEDIFQEQFKQADSFHYDSLVKFCLQPFKEELIPEVGLVIDDFKREEEHQMLIQMLREYVSKKDVVYESIHLLQGRNFMFFTDQGALLTKQVLKPLMEKIPLYLFGLHTKEWNLAPLIALSPRQIYLYGDLSEARNLTVMNVFQERVIVKARHEFPFIP